MKYRSLVPSMISDSRIILKTLVLTALGTAPLTAHALPSTAQEKVLIEAVVASVDGKPITLQDLSKRLKRKLSFKDAARDPEAQKALDELITERIILEESETRRLQVDEEEVNDYIEEVAKQNNLTREGFVQALREEGKNFEEYKSQVKFDILRSRITGAHIRGSVAVTDKEVDEYIKSHNEHGPRGASVEIDQILFSHEKHSKDELKKRIKLVLQKLDDGSDFRALAKQFSDSSDASEGGQLGIISEKDLNPAIFDAILPLRDGETSKLVNTPLGIHLFRLVKRVGPTTEDKVDDAQREQVRKLLEKQKFEVKLATFFSEEIQKLHAIDRKL